MLLFVVGTGRCGSTLAVETLARHREVGFVSNFDDKLSHLDLLGRWNNTLHRQQGFRDPRLRPFRDRRKLVERGRLRVSPSEGWSVLDRQVASLFSTPSRDLIAEDCVPWVRERLQSFFERRMAAQRRPVFVHHVTGWPRVGFLRAAFPEARFIHVVRDGRAVANSWLQMGWWRGYQGPSAWHLGPLPPQYEAEWIESGRSFVVLGGLGWKMLVEAFEAAQATVPAESWLEVRYEELIARPRHHMARMLDFAGLSWDDDFEVQFSQFRGGAGRLDAFRRDLGPDGVAALERSIGPTLRAYGYRTDAVSGADLREVHGPVLALR
jgi:hypothetical protein